MNIVDFFKGIGHFLGRTFGIIRKIVPEELLQQAIVLAREASVKFAENALRREWVLEQLMKLPGMRESTARLLVELAVQHLKADVIDELAEKAKKAVQSPPPAGSSTPAVGGTP